MNFGLTQINSLMKLRVFYFAFIFIVSNSFIVAQEIADDSSFYDYNEEALLNTASVPDYETKSEKLKISGTIFESDGVTPASNVILYIDQADETGDFDVRKVDDKKYVHHRAWVKTDEDGRYTFFTFIPGNDRRYNQLQQLFPVVKEPSKNAYELAAFLFDADPLLTNRCRKRLVKKGDPSRILSPKKEKDLFVVEKNIILPGAAK